MAKKRRTKVGEIPAGGRSGDLAAYMADAAANSEEFAKAMGEFDKRGGVYIETIEALTKEYSSLARQIERNREQFEEFYGVSLMNLIEGFDLGLTSAEDFTKGMLQMYAKTGSQGSAAAAAGVTALKKLRVSSNRATEATRKATAAFQGTSASLLDYKIDAAAAVKEAQELAAAAGDGSEKFWKYAGALNKYSSQLALLDFYPIRSEFLKTAGAMGEGQAHLHMLGRGTKKWAVEFGAGTLDAQKALIGLRQEFGRLNGAYDENSTELDLVLTLQQRFGADARASAHYFRLLTQGYGMTTEGAKDFYLELTNVADASGLVSSQLVNDMHENAAMISRFGINSTFALAKVAMASKRTGLAMGTIFDVADKFTSIQGAIESTAKLNAAFGTSLDAFSLFAEQDPAKIFASLQSQIQGSVGDFNNMNKQQRAFLAETLGLDDAQTRLFVSSKNLSVAFAQIQKDQKNQATLAKLSREAMTSMMPLLDNMTNMFMKMQPFIRGVAKGLNALAFVTAEIVGVMTSIFGSKTEDAWEHIGTAIGFLAGPVTLVLSLMKKFRTAAGAATAAAPAAAAAIGGAANTASGAIGRMTASLAVGGVQLAAVIGATAGLAVAMGYLTSQVAASPAGFAAATVGFVTFTAAMLGIGAALATPIGGLAGGSIALFLGGLAVIALGIGAAFKIAGSGIEQAARGINAITEISGNKFSDAVAGISAMKAELQQLSLVNLNSVEGSLNRITRKQYRATGNASKNFADGPTGKRSDPVYVNVVNAKEIMPRSRPGIGAGLVGGI